MYDGSLVHPSFLCYLLNSPLRASITHSVGYWLRRYFPGHACYMN
jgi:hypothetical protein